MVNRIAPLCVVSMLILNTPSAAYADGNAILPKCQAAIRVGEGDARAFDAKDLADANFCIGLAQGVTQTLRALQTVVPGIACLPPDGIPNGQAIRVFLKFLTDHPEKLHEAETFLLTQALHDAFPCAAPANSPH